MIDNPLAITLTYPPLKMKSFRLRAISLGTFFASAAPAPGNPGFIGVQTWSGHGCTGDSGYTQLGDPGSVCWENTPGSSLTS